jgi:hypothetical protein
VLLQRLPMMNGQGKYQPPKSKKYGILHICTWGNSDNPQPAKKHRGQHDQQETDNVGTVLEHKLFHATKLGQKRGLENFIVEP